MPSASDPIFIRTAVWNSMKCAAGSMMTCQWTRSSYSELSFGSRRRLGGEDLYHVCIHIQ